MRLKKNRGSVIAIVGFVVVILLLLRFLHFAYIDQRPTVFNIYAQTERIYASNLDSDLSRFVFRNTEIRSFEEVLFENFRGVFLPDSTTELTIQRIANGPAKVTFESLSSTVGTLILPDGSKSVVEDDFLEVWIRDPLKSSSIGETHVFSISGDVQFGRSIDYEVYGDTPAVLYGGEITMLGQSGITGTYFEAGREALSLGDKIELMGPKSSSYSLITINHLPALQATIRASADHVILQKPSPGHISDGYKVSANLFDRLLNDPLTQLLSIVGALLLFLSSIITFFMDSILFVKQRQEDS